jgi:hypothetical protein
MGVRAIQPTQVSAVTDANAGDEEAHRRRLLILLLGHDRKPGQCQRTDSRSSCQQDSFVPHHGVFSYFVKREDEQPDSAT